MKYLLNVVFYIIDLQTPFMAHTRQNSGKAIRPIAYISGRAGDRNSVLK